VHLGLGFLAALLQRHATIPGNSLARPPTRLEDKKDNFGAVAGFERKGKLENRKWLEAISQMVVGGRSFSSDKKEMGKSGL